MLVFQTLNLTNSKCGYEIVSGFLLKISEIQLLITMQKLIGILISKQLAG
nr:MAG TPA: hypothetical protein [Caudoviricetes sp.]